MVQAATSPLSRKRSWCLGQNLCLCRAANTYGFRLCSKWFWLIEDLFILENLCLAIFKDFQVNLKLSFACIFTLLMELISFKIKIIFIEILKALWIQRMIATSPGQFVNHVLGRNSGLILALSFYLRNTKPYFSSALLTSSTPCINGVSGQSFAGNRCNILPTLTPFPETSQCKTIWK